jgi:hypothetical protein
MSEQKKSSLNKIVKDCIPNTISQISEESIEKHIDINIDENINKDSSFILKKTVKSGNYSIIRKGSSAGNVQRVKYTIYGAYLPFGTEYYKDNQILNAVITDATNINHNLLVTLNKVIKTFENLKTTDSGNKYMIHNKLFFSFLKNINTCEDCDKNVNKYQLRLYFKYGVKITHAKCVGELSHNQLKGKRCNINIELGSMWVNEQTMQYGINIFITHITVLN